MAIKGHFVIPLRHSDVLGRVAHSCPRIWGMSGDPQKSAPHGKGTLNILHSTHRKNAMNGPPESIWIPHLMKHIGNLSDKVASLQCRQPKPIFQHLEFIC